MASILVQIIITYGLLQAFLLTKYYNQSKYDYITLLLTVAGTCPKDLHCAVDKNQNFSWPAMFCMTIIHWLLQCLQEQCNSLTVSILTLMTSPVVYIGFTLLLYSSMGLTKCVMTCVYHCSVIQDSSTVLGIFCGSYILLSIPSITLAITDIFTSP